MTKKEYEQIKAQFRIKRVDVRKYIKDGKQVGTATILRWFDEIERHITYKPRRTNY